MFGIWHLAFGIWHLAFGIWHLAFGIDMTRSQFHRRVLNVVRRIPPGRVATYGDVAELAGAPRAARAVGTVMRTAGMPGVPYHRVVAAGGRLGGYGGSEALKRALLQAEGLVVSGTRIREFSARRWRGSPAR
jgi:O-6-methylguanine DNA methyltransferase